MVRNATVIIFLGLIFYFYYYQMVLGELSTGDIAQFTPKQADTYRSIKSDVMHLSNGTDNDSTLTNEEIQNQIMESVIRSGLNYCAVWNDDWEVCKVSNNINDIVTIL